MIYIEKQWMGRPLSHYLLLFLISHIEKFLTRKKKEKEKKMWTKLCNSDSVWLTLSLVVWLLQLKAPVIIYHYYYSCTKNSSSSFLSQLIDCVVHIVCDSSFHIILMLSHSGSNRQFQSTYRFTSLKHTLMSVMSYFSFLVMRFHSVIFFRFFSVAFGHLFKRKFNFSP